jgi:DNA-binding response OmpR family regulator
MGKKILVIEDERDISDLVVHYLEKEGHRVMAVRNGAKGLSLLKTDPPDLLILDLMLPEMDGLEILRQIRSHSKTAALPVILLTAKAEETDRVVGLEMGADDYVPKPFSPKELAARVKALLRRLERREAAPARHVYRDLVLEADRHEVTLKGKEISLTAKEFSLLQQLLENRGRVLTREVLLDRVWGYDADVTTRTVDVHIRRLREKIPILSEAIQTVKSMGYKLKDAE